MALVAQAKMSKEYPCHYSSTALMSTAGAIQATTFGFCFDRDLIQWKLGWNIRLLAVAYSVYILICFYIHISQIYHMVYLEIRSITSFHFKIIVLSCWDAKYLFSFSYILAFKI